MTQVIVNGSVINGSGNIIVSKNKIFVDGVDVTPDSKEINISVNGNIDTIKVDNCNKFTVEGSVKQISTMSGDVEITGDVDGNVKTMSGDVDCGNIQGSVSTMSGNIKHK